MKTSVIEGSGLEDLRERIKDLIRRLDDETLVAVGRIYYGFVDMYFK